MDGGLNSELRRDNQSWNCLCSSDGTYVTETTHKKLPPSRLDRELIALDEAIESLRPGVPGIIAGGLFFALVLLTVDLVSRVAFVGVVNVPWYVGKVIGIAGVSIFTIGIAILVSFLVIFLVDVFFRGLLAHRTKIALLGGLSGFLASIAWFQALPFALNAPPNPYLSFILVGVAATACQFGAIQSAVSRFENGFGASNQYYASADPNFQFRLTHLMVLMLFVGVILSIDRCFTDHWFLCRFVFYCGVQMVLLVVDRWVSPKT